jgi:mannose-6-phosphate isomerase
MSALYPLKFIPIYKERIWGGNKLKQLLDKDFSPLTNCGESWELSGVEDDVSVVSNGFLKGNTLEEIIEVYMGDLVGEKVYEQFGTEFPLLIKYIDANDNLSIQVHPDDELSRERHGAYGKTEMWLSYRF